MKQRYLLTFVVTIGVSLLGALASVGAFVLLNARIQDAHTDLGDIAGEIITREEARKNARILAAVLVEKQSDIARVQSFFVDRNRPVEFIEALEHMAVETQVTLALSIDEASTRTDLLVFRLSVDGEAAAVRTYLGLLETMPYAVRVAAFQYHSDDSGEAKAGAHASLSVLLEVEGRIL